MARDPLCSDLAVLTLHWMSEHPRRWAQMHPDPAHRHGDPGAGWYRATTQGWQPITDTEAATERYEDMRHFMTDPREADGGTQPTTP
jgi:hypothetical protein